MILSDVLDALRTRFRRVHISRSPRRRFGRLHTAAIEALEDRTLLSAPSFSPSTYSTSVAEDVAVGTSVQTVTASDPDGDPLNYMLSGGDMGMFMIDSTTGEITTAVELDFETTSTYSLTVDVDDGMNFDTATVTVNVTDVADDTAPTIDSGQSFSVPEDAIMGTPVGMVTASDPDGDPLNYMLSGGDMGMFMIDSTTGEITTSGTLDFETASTYSLTVDVDDGMNFDTATVTVNVTDVVENSAPSIASGLSFSIAEDAATEATVGTVTASDPDSDPLTYTLTGGDMGTFTIDSTTGEITVSGTLDYETMPSHTLTVEVSDGTETASETMTVDVTDVNEAPVITSFSNTWVYEDFYSFTGYVEDEDPSTAVVNFGGYLAGETATVEPDGYFSLIASIGSDSDVSVTATATDDGGLTSDEEITLVFVF